MGDLEMMRRPLVIFLLVSLVIISPGLLHQARGQNDVSVMYVSPLRPPSTGQPFTVAVGLNLSSTDGISGYDVLLRSNFYNGTPVSPPVLNPVSIKPGNVFQGLQTLPLTNCVNGSGTGCDPAKGDGPGAVHSATVVLGDPVPGGQSVTLFYVDFTVVGTGISLLDFTNDNVTYSPTVPGYGPNTVVVLHLTYDGIFSNQGLAPFFNIASPAIAVVGVPIIFDASGSFNPDGSSITLYRWDFGDGNKTSVPTPTVAHPYNRSGSYGVTLNVTDGKAWRTIARTVTVSSGLGALRIFPVPVTGTKASFQGNITVTLHNITASGSTLLGSLVKNPAAPWVLFPGLKAGQYRVDFSGEGVTAFSKTETVIPGWTTWDTVYLSVSVPVPPNPPDYLLLLLVGVLGAGVPLGLFGIFLRRRNTARRVKARSSKGRRA